MKLFLIISFLLLPTVSNASMGYYCHYEGKVVKVEPKKSVTVKLTSLMRSKKYDLCAKNLNKEHTFNYKFSLKNIESTFFQLEYSYICCGKGGESIQDWKIFKGPYMKLMKKEKKEKTKESGCNCQTLSGQNGTRNPAMIFLAFLAFLTVIRFRK